MKNMKNTRSFLYLLACRDAKYFKKIYGVIGNYLSVIDSIYGVRIMRANIANKYPNETMVILNKILPEDTIIWQYSNKTTNKIMVTCIYNLSYFLI
jgi:hypothetical protein